MLVYQIGVEIISVTNFEHRSFIQTQYHKAEGKCVLWNLSDMFHYADILTDANILFLPSKPKGGNRELQNSRQIGAVPKRGRVYITNIGGVHKKKNQIA